MPFPDGSGTKPVLRTETLALQASGWILIERCQRISLYVLVCVCVCV